MVEGFGVEGIWELRGEVDEQVESYYDKTKYFLNAAISKGSAS